MTALTTERNTSEAANDVKRIKPPVKGEATTFRGAIVAIGVDGYVVPASKSTDLTVAGRVEETATNTGVDGAKSILVARGVFIYKNSANDKLDATRVLKPCYTEDDQTVSKTNTGSSAAGLVIRVDGEGAAVEIGFGLIVPSVTAVKTKQGGNNQMITTSQTLRGIYVGLNTLLNKAPTETSVLYQRAAMVCPFMTSGENYARLGDIPGMKEWSGEREIQNLASSSYTIKNKDFEGTIGIPRNAIEDDKIGLYSPSIQMLGQSAAQHPDELIFGLLKSGLAELRYDGKPFFSVEHPAGRKKVSNKGAEKLTIESYVAACTVTMGFFNSKGHPLKLVPNLLVVPSALEETTLSITKGEFINGAANTTKGTAEALVVPDLAESDTVRYLFCATRPIRLLIYQERRKPKFISKTGEQDDNVFFDKQYIHGVDSRGNAGFGFWQMGYGSNGTTGGK